MEYLGLIVSGKSALMTFRLCARAVQSDEDLELVIDMIGAIHAEVRI